MNLVPYPAHDAAIERSHSVPRLLAPRFEETLRRRLAVEFPGEQFRLYPDVEGTNVMIIALPPGRAVGGFSSAVPGAAVAAERRIRSIVGEVMLAGEWRPDEHARG